MTEILGHDTTAHSMAWFIYEMTQNPDCYEKIQREIHEIIGEGETNSSHVGKFKFIEECWKETLRLYPAAPGGTRSNLCN